MTAIVTPGKEEEPAPLSREAVPPDRLLAIHDLAPDAIVTMDAQGVILDWNPSAERMFGWRREEVLGRRAVDVIIPAHHRDDYLLGLERYRKAGEATSLGQPRRDLSALHRDGHEFPVELIVNQATGPEGSVFVGFVRDITERRAAEEALDASLLRFRTLFEGQPVATALLGPDFHFRSVNDAFCRLVGREASQIARLRAQDLLHPDDVPLAEGEIRSVLEGRAAEVRMELRYLDAQGGVRWMASIVRGVRDDRGRLLHLLASAEDVTDRRRAQEDLRASEERFRLLLEGARDYSIFMLDAGGRVSSWNAGAERFTGFTTEEIVGRHCSVFYPPEEVAAGAPQRELAAAAREGRTTDEGWRLRKDGSRYWAHVLITAVQDPAGALLGFTHVTHDLSERRQAEALQHARFAVTEALAAAPSLTAAAGQILAGLCQHLGWVLGELWIVDEAAGVLRFAETWHERGGAFDAFTAAGRARTLSRDQGLPGLVWGSSRPAIVADLSADLDFVRSQAAVASGLQGAIGFPILNDAGQVVGVIVAYGRESIPLDERLLAVMSDVGRQIGQFVERKRLEELLRKEDSLRRRGGQAEPVLEYQPFHDALTGLPNRALFRDRLLQAMALADRERRGCAVLLLDLDGFKSVNDAHGHQVGDLVLKEVALRVQRELRRSDTVARLGGDEFAIITEGGRDPEAAMGVAHKLERAFRTPVVAAGVTAPLTASLGIAWYPIHGTSPDLLLRNADTAMYRAKRGGGGCLLYEETPPPTSRREAGQGRPKRG